MHSNITWWYLVMLYDIGTNITKPFLSIYFLLLYLEFSASKESPQLKITHTGNHLSRTEPAQRTGNRNTNGFASHSRYWRMMRYIKWYNINRRCLVMSCDMISDFHEHCKTLLTYHNSNIINTILLIAVGLSDVIFSDVWIAVSNGISHTYITRLYLPSRLEHLHLLFDP